MKRAVWTKEKGSHEVDMTAEEITQKEIDDKDWWDKLPERQLKKIKQLRNQKLSETDWLVTSGQITDAQKEYRQKLRDIPADYDSSKYDELLARDDSRNLTHAVWKKP